MHRSFMAIMTTMAILAFAFNLSAQESPKPLRAGIIGLDTSHAPAFAKVFNAPNATGDVAGIRVVAAFPGGSDDLPSSHDRVAGYTKELRDAGVEIVGSIDELLTKVDVVLLESVDGRPHWKQAQPVIRAHKTLFIDKPVAASLADTMRIFDLAEKEHVPCFTSSALRFTKQIAGLRHDDRVGDVVGCVAYSPCPLEEHHPDLFWYGIHGVESLYTIMGEGCVRVTRIQTEGADEVVGVWKDGRIGTFRGIRTGHADYGAFVFGTKGIVQSGGFGGYEPLVAEIAKFFKTGKPPVSASETIELVAFMEAADASKKAGGCPVAIADVMKAARAEAEKPAP